MQRGSRHHEGGAVYACQAEGAWWLIIDEGTLVDLLDPDAEADVSAQLVTVQRFVDVASWEDAQAEARRDANEHEGAESP